MVLAAAFAIPVMGCDGLRDAFTSHVDVAARAGPHELTATRLAELIGNSDLPATREVAETVTDLWINYQLLGQAAARGDSLTDRGAIDQAMFTEVAQARVGRWYEVVSQTWGTGAEQPTEADYRRGDVLAARHILFRFPQNATPQQRDSVRRQAEAVRAQATPAHFATLAQRHGQDGTAQQGGSLGFFGRGEMVPDFERAVVALQPGEIGPIVETQFGYHIIMREPFVAVREEFAQQHTQLAMQRAESTYMARLEQAGNIRVRQNAPAVVKRIAANPEGFRRDRTVIATSTAGDLTAARMAQWIRSFPPQAQIQEQLQQAPDTMIPMFVRNIIGRELLLAQADSAAVDLDTAQRAQLYDAFGRQVSQAWQALRIAPQQLRDTASAAGERERIAGQRVEQYIERLIAGQAQFVPIAPPVESMLRERYDYRRNEAGIDRAVERAQQIRQTAEAGRAQEDSARRARQPQSDVPMPRPQAPSSQQPPTP